MERWFFVCIRIYNCACVLVYMHIFTCDVMHLVIKYLNNTHAKVNLFPTAYIFTDINFICINEIERFTLTCPKPDLSFLTINQR